MKKNEIVKDTVNNADNHYTVIHTKNLSIIKKVSLATLIVNVFLTIAKGLVGVLFFNISVISDAVHSFTDIMTTVLVIISAVISKPCTDKEHNYGHEKREPVVTLFFSVILAATAAMLMYQGIIGIVNKSITHFSPYLIGVTVVSILSKESMFWFTRHFAKITNSDALKADAWHHRSDSLSSVAVLIGLVCSIFVGNNIGESIAILIVSLLILKIAFDICRTSIGKLVDKAADESTCKEIEQVTAALDGVRSVDLLKTRQFGNALLVDIEIAVDENLDVSSAHAIADNVHDAIEALQKYSIKHCSVHVNPYKKD